MNRNLLACSVFMLLASPSLAMGQDDTEKVPIWRVVHSSVAPTVQSEPEPSGPSLTPLMKRVGFFERAVEARDLAAAKSARGKVQTFMRYSIEQSEIDLEWVRLSLIHI